MKMTRGTTSKDEEQEEHFAETVKEKEDRKLRAKQEKKSSIWFGFGMFGMVGWSVAVPTVIGTGIGVWLDARYPGTVSWTLTGVIAGVMVGCLIAWNWVQKESHHD